MKRTSKEEITLYPAVTRERLRKNPNARAVADELGVHISTVYRHAEGMDLGLLDELRSKNWEIKEIIKYMYRVMGIPRPEVAEKLGCTLQYVSQVLKENEEVAA